MSDLNWIPILGKFTHEDGKLVFHGEPAVSQDMLGSQIGNALSNRRFSGGRISCVVNFPTLDPAAGCEIMVNFNPATRAFVTAGLGGAGMFSVRHFFNQWSVLATAGDRENLQPNRDYALEVDVRGSQIQLTVDGVDVIRTQFPIPLPESQVGIWCRSDSRIEIESYSVEAQPPTVFVVMEFSSPFNEIYLDVIQRVCDELGIEAIRADDMYGPGVIVYDIAQQIIGAQAVIAEITPVNANVYYEVGFAHALGKPTILLADKETKVPFDVSPFRILFYENTIPGKSKFEAGLRRHLNAIFQRQAV
jgi:hypothetical protein